MGEGSKDLSPDDTKISNAPIVDLGEDSVEDVAEQMHAQPSNHGFTSSVASASKWAGSKDSALDVLTNDPIPS